jgi:hypothetical protein
MKTEFDGDSKYRGTDSSRVVPFSTPTSEQSRVIPISTAKPDKGRYSKRPLYRVGWQPKRRSVQ